MSASVRTASPSSAGTAARVRRRGPDPWKTSFFVVAVAALVGGVAWALLGSSFFVVRSVQVSGAGSIPRQQVLAAARVKIGTPLIRIDAAAVARRVDKITRVQSASVRRSWPDSIVIAVVPRTPTFLVRAGRGFDVIDSYGVVLGRAVRPRAGLVLLKAPAGPVTSLRGNAEVLAAGAVVRRLPAWLRHKLTEVRVRRGSGVILMLRPRVTVVWGNAAAGAAKAAEVAVLLPTNATYYDVSDPGSAVTGRPAGG
ncbi:MAG TPA: FtsQ-type POTRA domain-containing protein [Streptosporangiaceae bacterium]|nr:FtsQ-type POTRA domain-containing protein [Streptosporangiaceae bacterium]